MTMGMVAETQEAGQDLELVVSRVIKARRELVWSVWTDERHVERWWRPEGFRNAICERMVVRPGGSFRIVMPAEKGGSCVAWGTFTDVVPYERLAYEDRCDVDGRTIHAATLEITFEDCAEGTRVTISSRIELAGYAGTKWTPELIEDGWTRGWNTNIDNLAGGLAGDIEERGFTLTRVFDAPRDLVFRVWTEPQHVRHWSVPPGYTLFRHDDELCQGGSYVMGIRSPEGDEYLMRGVYTLFDPPERLAFTYAMDGKNGEPGEQSIASVDFAEENGRTRVTFSQALFPTAGARDDHESGMASCFDQMASYLADLQTREQSDGV